MHRDVRNRLLLAGWLLVILYCMFFAFGRGERFDSYQASFAITGIPLWLPKHLSWDLLRLWVFALGNLAAFLPFGVLLPCNLHTARGVFWKSLLLFLLGITLLEGLQMLSLRGSFDLEDILVNTLGFLIGYAAWRGSRRGKSPLARCLCFWTLSALFLLLVLLCAEGINPFLRG